MASFSSAFTQLPIDWIVIGALVALIALDALRSGSNRATTIALAAPFAFLFMTGLPTTAVLGTLSSQLQAGAAQGLLFGALFVALFFVFYRIVDSFSETGGVVQALLAGVSATAVFVVVWLQVPALQSLWQFGPQVQLVFGEAYRLWWMLAAYLALAFVRS